MNTAPLFEPVKPKALSVRQPWAHLIMTGQKRIENRSWRTEYRGPLYIHAGQRLHETPIPEIERMFGLTINATDLQFGAIIGRVQLVDVITRSTSPWFFGPYGFVFERPEPIKPISWRGQQKLFDLADDLARQLSTRR